jgi:hypothetical protein
MSYRALVAALALTFGAPAQLVSPAGLATQGGNSSNNYPFSSTFHYLQIHGDVRGAGQLIRGQSHRRTASGAGQIARMLEVEIWMGEGDFAAATPTFALNYTTPRTPVFSKKMVSAPSWESPVIGNPPPFDLNFAYDAPFAYSGSRDLVWEMVLSQNSANQQPYPANAHEQFRQCGGTRAHGTGCVASGQSRAMSMSGQHCSSARTGTVDTSWWVYDGAANAAGAFLIGASNPALPLPGLCATTLYTDAKITLFASTDSTGFMSTPYFQAPYSAGLVGLTLWSQAVVVDAGQPGLPLAFSNGLESTVIAPPVMGRFCRLWSSPTITVGSLDLGYAIVTRFDP